MQTIKTEKIGKRTWVILEQFGPVEPGFITDGASVPRLFWWIASPCTDAFEAAVLHDWRLFNEMSNPHWLFFVDLLRYGVPKWRAYLLYLAVKFWFALKGMRNAIKRLFRKPTR